MNFDNKGRLIVKTCLCGVAELGDILASSDDLKAIFGNRDILYFHTVISRKCAEKYFGVKANIERENCLSYQG